MLQVHAYIEVADIDEGVAFYTQGLGLLERRRLTPTWAELSGASIPVHLLGNRKASFRAGDHVLHREFDRHWTPVHLDFVVERLEPAVQRAVHAGATVERALVEHPGFRMANLADPFGNGFDLIELVDGGYDALPPVA